jgi:hypothetical protein
MKAYLDNDVVSAIAKDDNDAESATLTRLFSDGHRGSLGAWAGERRATSRACRPDRERGLHFVGALGFRSLGDFESRLASLFERDKCLILLGAAGQD